MRGQKRPTDQRARAVGIAVLTGNVSEAARQTGLAASTITEWLTRPEFVELRERNKDAVAAEWWAGIQEVARTILRDAEQAPVKDRAVAFAIMFDKLALIRGEATERTEVRDLTNVFEDHELDLLRSAIQRETAAEPEAEAAVVGPGEGQPASS